MMIMTRQENGKNTKKAIEAYKKSLKEIQLPVCDKQQLFDTVSKIKGETLSRLRSNLLFDMENEIEKETEVILSVRYK